MFFRFSCRLVLGLIAISLLGALARAEVVQLDDDANDIAVDQHTGGVCVINSEKGQVSLYPILSSHGILDGRIDRTVGKEPHAVIYRQFSGKAYFIVSCSDKTLWVLDAEKLTVVKTVEVAQSPTSIAAAIKGDSPYVYYGFEGSLGCMDLRDFTDHPNLMGSSGMTSFMDIGASADGHLVYSRGLQRSPSGRTVCSIEDTAKGSPIVKNLGYEHNSVSDFRPDPFSPFCQYIGSYGMGPDPYVALPDLKANCSWIMQTRPLIVADTGNSIVFYSYNTLKELTTVAFNGNNGNGNVARNRPGVRPNQRQFNPNGQHKVLVDEKNGNVLIWSETSINVIELSSINLPDEPLLGVNIDGTSVLHPDAPATVVMKKLNPDSKLELIDPRDGMRLDNETLRWTPGGNDVGSVPVKVRISAKGFERVQSFTLTIRRPELDLPFIPQEAVLSADGKYILLLQGSPAPNVFQQRGMPGQGQVECKLALVDSATQTIVRNATLPRTVHCIAIDANHAYAAATDSDAIYMYSLKDLSEERKVFASAPVREICPAGGRLFVISQQNNFTEYSLPDLKPVESGTHGPEARSRFARMNSQLTAPHLSQAGWEFDGVLFDKEFKHAIRLENPGDFVTFPAATPNPNAPMGYNPAMFNQQPAAQATGWGLSIQNDRLMRSASQSLGTFQGGNATFLHDVPALATLQVESHQVAGNPFEPPRVSTTLNLYDLVSASKKQSIVLSDEQRQVPQQAYPGQPTTGQSLLTSPGRLVAWVEDKLYFIDLSKLDAIKFPEPPQLSCNPGAVTFDAAKISAIEMVTSHIKSPVQFMLDPDVKGVEIDATTGKLTVNGPDLISQASDALKRAIIERTSGIQPNGAPAGLTPEQALQTMLETANARYTALTGTPLTGTAPQGAIPMLLHLNVVAVDADQQKISCPVGGFMFVPMQEALAAVAAQQEQLNDANNQGADQPGRRGRRPTTQRAGAPLQEQIDKLTARIAELEKQNTELSAQNKMLKEMVMELKK